MPDLTRRHFLGMSSLLVAACTRRPAPRDAALPTPHIVDDDPPPTCSGATAANIEGPFYKPGAPHRAVLASDADRGERLVLSGVVRTTACAALAGAELDVWHADATGAYDNAGYHLRGTLVTDARGRWEVHTIMPGRYLNGPRYRPAHVHFKLRAAGHRELTTQLYFDGDPYNDGDPFIVPSLIMAHRIKDGVRCAAFDFVLA